MQTQWNYKIKYMYAVLGPEHTVAKINYTGLLLLSQKKLLYLVIYQNILTAGKYLSSHEQTAELLQFLDCMIQSQVTFLHDQITHSLMTNTTCKTNSAGKGFHAWISVSTDIRKYLYIKHIQMYMCTWLYILLDCKCLGFIWMSQSCFSFNYNCKSQHFTTALFVWRASIPINWPTLTSRY